MSMEWGAEPAMSDMEALMWRSEASPRLRSGGVILDILDRTPDWDRLRGRARVGRDPRAAAARARDRGPVEARPRPRGRWPRTSTSATTCAACGVPEDGDDRRRARDCAGAGDGAVRPRAPAVGGGADRRACRAAAAAYALKLHHSLLDGAAGIQLFDILHSDRPEPTRRSRPAGREPHARAEPGATGSRARSAAPCAGRPAAPAARSRCRRGTAAAPRADAEIRGCGSRARCGGSPARRRPSRRR